MVSKGERTVEAAAVNGDLGVGGLRLGRLASLAGKGLGVGRLSKGLGAPLQPRSCIPSVQS
jgi:hypothetical protein